MQLKKVRSYIARYPVIMTAQSALHFTGKPAHSELISTSLGSILREHQSFIYPQTNTVYTPLNILYEKWTIWHFSSIYKKESVAVLRDKETVVTESQ